LPVNVVLDKNTKSIESVDTDQFKVKSPFWYWFKLFAMLVLATVVVVGTALEVSVCDAKLTTLGEASLLLW
jgi:hypothetical protein